MTNCRLFENYEHKEYKITIKHKIFGESKITGAIGGFIDDADRLGVIVRGKGIYCYKTDSQFKFNEENDVVTLEDTLMKIFIKKLF